MAAADMAASANVATAATARMGKATWGMRKPAAKRMEVVEPLFAHGAAEGVWLQLRSWRRGRGVPRGAGVSFPGAGRALAIDASVSTAVEIVWRERPRRYGRWRNVRLEIGLFKSTWHYGRFCNLRVEIAVVGAKRRDTGMVEGMARIWTEVAAPIARPFPTVPRVESIPVFGVRDARPPVVINVNVIEADVIVIEVVPPPPFIRPPPRMPPRPQPFAGAKSEAEPNPPVVGEPRPKSIGTGRA